jgi:catechol 2,3-dioxygenase-like lactoylglutathione lyase family enzyme
MSATYPVHHITLSVSDIASSVEWFQNVLGSADIVEREFEDFSRTRMTWPELDDLRIAVMTHKAMDRSSTFSHLQPGLDHLGFECKTPEEVNEWASKLDDLGYTRGPVEDVPYAVYVTARTPDNIPIEFFFPK